MGACVAGLGVHQLFIQSMAVFPPKVGVRLADNLGGQSSLCVDGNRWMLQEVGYFFSA